MDFLRPRRLLQLALTAFAVMLSSVGFLAASHGRRTKAGLEERHARSQLDETLERLPLKLDRLAQGWEKHFSSHVPSKQGAQASKTKALAGIQHGIARLKLRSDQQAEQQGRVSALKAERSLHVLKGLQAQADEMSEALNRQADDLRRMESFGTL